MSINNIGGPYGIQGPDPSREISGHQRKGDLTAASFEKTQAGADAVSGSGVVSSRQDNAIVAFVVGPVAVAVAGVGVGVVAALVAGVETVAAVHHKVAFWGGKASNEEAPVNL